MPIVLWQNFFKDKKGNLVIAQKPNLPLIVWLFSFLLTRLNINQTATELFQLVSFGALFTWAWLELFEGVNLFRRILGAVVMMGLLYISLVG